MDIKVVHLAVRRRILYTFVTLGVSKMVKHGEDKKNGDDDDDEDECGDVPTFEFL